MEVHVSYTVWSEWKGMEILLPTLHCGPHSCMKTFLLGKIHTHTAEWSYSITGIISGKSFHILKRSTVHLFSSINSAGSFRNSAFVWQVNDTAKASLKKPYFFFTFAPGIILLLIKTFHGTTTRPLSLHKLVSMWGLILCLCSCTEGNQTLEFTCALHELFANTEWQQSEFFSPSFPWEPGNKIALDLLQALKFNFLCKIWLLSRKGCCIFLRHLCNCKYKIQQSNKKSSSRVK